MPQITTVGVELQKRPDVKQTPLSSLTQPRRCPEDDPHIVCVRFVVKLQRFVEFLCVLFSL